MRLVTTRESNFSTSNPSPNETDRAAAGSVTPTRVRTTCSPSLMLGMEMRTSSDTLPGLAVSEMAGDGTPRAAASLAVKRSASKASMAPERRI